MTKTREERLRLETKTRKERLRLESQISEIETSCEKRIERVHRKIWALQNECQHRNSVFHDDPAGGFDSYYLCIDCGKRVV